MSDPNAIEKWAKRMERVLKETPSGHWLFVVGSGGNGSLLLMRLGADGNRITGGPGGSMDQDAIVRDIKIPDGLQIDGGDF